MTPDADTAPISLSSSGLSNPGAALELQLGPAGLGGCLRRHGLALNRDLPEASGGMLCYLRDRDSGDHWRITGTPQLDGDLTASRVHWDWSEGQPGTGLSVRVELRLETDQAGVEQRRLVLHNASPRVRRLQLVTYLEVVLFPAEADRAHPAFAKLFVQTEWLPDPAALLARRRARARGESWPWLAHTLRGAVIEGWESDRARFTGRGGSLQHPAALTGAAAQPGSTGNVLDPCLSLRATLELAAGASQTVTVLTVTADAREALIERLSGLDRRLGRAIVQPRMDDPAPQPESADAAPPAALRAWNGYGGFTAAGDAYEIHLPWQAESGRHRLPPAPWCNVLANPRAGCLTSERGIVYSWARNSQANRLTPWNNDPVRDPPGEGFSLFDPEQGHGWALTPATAAGIDPAPVSYRVRHGFGVTSYEGNYQGLAHRLEVWVPAPEGGPTEPMQGLGRPVRLARLTLGHHGNAPRRLWLSNQQQLLLGSATGPKLELHADDAAGVLLARHRHPHSPFADGIAFARMITEPQPEEVTRLQTEDEHGQPAFVLTHELTLPPGCTRQLTWVLGEATSEAELAALLANFHDPEAIDADLQRTRDYWQDLADQVTVDTPSEAINLMLSGWLAYQTLACRLWARSAFYQSGGAWGYRDQLQDALALVALRPELTRAQLLRHAGAQFVEGDVLHWWHPAPINSGLRTRFADDLLWLPFVLTQYLKASGDVTVLDEVVPFQSARLLEPGEDEAYLTPQPVDETADLYAHACRAIDRSLAVGVHGLPLMGTGDWNDGMNRVGREGRGESVWMAFFLHRVLADFESVAALRGDSARVQRYAAHRVQLQQALDQHGWDGAWYRRAYHDDGTPIGTSGSAECRIDALAQAWAVLSGAVPEARARTAMQAPERELMDAEHGLIRLLTPPFQASPFDPGYIQGYVAGVRENGGQYTHAACWSVMALAELGQHEAAATWLERLTPVWHSRDAAAAQRYRLEPYVVAADIYGAAPHIGRGGWSWYTGSAGWLLRAGIESVLGLHLEDGTTLRLRPGIPSSWPGYRLRYRLPQAFGGARCEITLKRSADSRGNHIHTATVNGEPVTPEADGSLRVAMAPGGERLTVEAWLS